MCFHHCSKTHNFILISMHAFKNIAICSIYVRVFYKRKMSGNSDVLIKILITTVNAWKLSLQGICFCIAFVSNCHIMTATINQCVGIIWNNWVFSYLIINQEFLLDLGSICDNNACSE